METIITIDAHCTNDSNGEYTLRVRSNAGMALIGKDAASWLEEAFSNYDAPMISFKIPW